MNAPGGAPALLKNGTKLDAYVTIAARVSVASAEVAIGTKVLACLNPFSRSITIDIVPVASGYATYEVNYPQSIMVKRLFAGRVEAGRLLPLTLDGATYQAASTWADLFRKETFTR